MVNTVSLVAVRMKGHKGFTAGSLAIPLGVFSRKKKYEGEIMYLLF